MDGSDGWGGGGSAAGTGSGLDVDRLLQRAASEEPQLNTKQHFSFNFLEADVWTDGQIKL